MIPYRAESDHFLLLMNSAATGCEVWGPLVLGLSGVFIELAYAKPHMSRTAWIPRARALGLLLEVWGPESRHPAALLQAAG